MEQIRELLNKIREIVIRDRAFQEERRLRGEKFNIFRILELSKNETRLHSAFLASLLDGNGDHGLRGAFLNSFFDNILPDFDFNRTNSQVYVEYPIGNKNKEETEGGRIDILIKDGSGNAVVIENKIDARDQTNQLLRYNNYAKINFKSFKLIYLTPYGTAPSELSTGAQEIDYVTLSYDKDIIGWMEENIRISSRTPLIRETLFQYVVNLKEILNIMDEDSRDKLVNLATSPAYIESTIRLMESENYIKASIREHFISELKELTERKGLRFEYDEDIVWLQDDQWINMSMPRLKGEWSIFIGWDKHNSRGGAKFGISRFMNEKVTKLYKNTINSLPQIWRNEKNEEYPFGWDFLWSPNGKKNSGRWWDWNHTDTLKAMVNGELIKFIETKIIDVALDNKLLQKINNLSSKS